MSGKWRHELFDYCYDCELCLVSSFVPCYKFGQNAEAVDESCCFCGFVCLACPWFWPFMGGYIRTKIRQRKGIKGYYTEDFRTWCFCPLCALIQETQELQDIRPVVVHPAAVHPEAVQPVAVHPVAVQSLAVPSVTQQPVAVQPGTVHPGAVQPVKVHPVAIQSVAVQPGTVKPVTEQPVAVQPEAVQPGAAQMVTQQPASTATTQK